MVVGWVQQNVGAETSQQRNKHQKAPYQIRFGRCPFRRHALSFRRTLCLDYSPTLMVFWAFKSAFAFCMPFELLMTVNGFQSFGGGCMRREICHLLRTWVWNTGTIFNRYGVRFKYKQEQFTCFHASALE